MKRPYYLLAVIVGAAIALLLSAFAYYGAAANARVVAVTQQSTRYARRDSDAADLPERQGTAGKLSA